MFSSCDNAFIGRLVMPGHLHTMIAALNCIMIPCTFTANLIMIYSLFKTRQLGSIVNRFFLCLCVSDCCIAIIVQSLVAILFTLYRDQHACYLEMSTQFLTFLFGHFSGFTIVAIGIDRYVHMKYLQRYDSIITKRRAVIAVLCCGFSAIIMGSAYTLSTVYGIFQWVNMAILLADFVAIIIICAAYIQAYNKVRDHLNRTKGLRSASPYKQASSSNTKKTSAPSYAIAMIITIMLILGAVFVCYVPYVCVGMMRFYRVQIKGKALYPSLAFGIYLTYLLVYLNSFLNAAIFIYKNDAIRQFIKNRFRSPKNYDVTPSTSSMQLSKIKESNSDHSIVSFKEDTLAQSKSTLKLI